MYAGDDHVGPVERSIRTVAKGDHERNNEWPAFPTDHDEADDGRVGQPLYQMSQPDAKSGQSIRPHEPSHNGDGRGAR